MTLTTQYSPTTDSDPQDSRLKTQDFFHYSAKDKIWVSQALAAASGALAASKRRLRQHLRSLPPDSPEALAISSFLQFGP